MVLAFGSDTCILFKLENEKRCDNFIFIVFFFQLKEALSIKSEKCESLLNRIKDLELQRDDVSDIKSLLAEKV